jgi:hypothetical protein
MNNSLSTNRQVVVLVSDHSPQELKPVFQPMGPLPIRPFKINKLVFITKTLRNWWGGEFIFYIFCFLLSFTSKVK